MRERFAPSPTGLLHLGHAFSALTAWRAAKEANGTFLLRIEDIDFNRCRPEFEQAIYDDLHWLGLDWPLPVMRQSTRFSAYKAALNQLIDKGLCYPCRCTRRDIAMAASAPQEGMQAQGDETLIYPGTCRNRPISERMAGDAIRLDMTAAIDHLGGDRALSQLTWLEIGSGFATEHALSAKDFRLHHGDIVLARRDIGTSYHLAVVVDDAEQAITHVTRGQDMAEATPIHRLLQALLDLPTPIYRHHRLIRDAQQKRLAKRDNARAIRRYRDDGLSPDAMMRLLSL